MTTSDRPGTIRSCALALIDVLDACGDDVGSHEKELTVAMEDLLALPGLDEVPATPTRTDDGVVGWIYYDGDLRIVRGRMAAGMRLEPHDHGEWNLFAVYHGAVHYTSYRRLDDQTVPYHAELEAVEDRVMRDGDVTVMPGPPGDIHGVVALAPMTTTLLVARGAFLPTRRQYLPEQNTYLEFEGDGLDATKAR